MAMWLFTSTDSGIPAQLYLLGSRCLSRVGARTCYYFRQRAVCSFASCALVSISMTTDGLQQMVMSGSP